jgi:hypothetical protein
VVNARVHELCMNRFVAAVAALLSQRHEVQTRKFHYKDNVCVMISHLPAAAACCLLQTAQPS